MLRKNYFYMLNLECMIEKKLCKNKQTHTKKQKTLSLTYGHKKDARKIKPGK